MVNNDNENNDDIEEITDEATDMTEPELEDIEELEENKLKKLRDKLQQVEDDKRQALEDLAMAKADFLNGKRRLEEEKLRDIERQKHKDIEALLPLCDSFTAAMANQDAWNAVDETWRKGVEGIYQNLQGILKKHNVEVVDPAGETFDPALHEAMSTIESEEPADTIVETLQLGYRMGDTIIRHAKVVISS